MNNTCMFIADIILYNGEIHTVDKEDSIKEAVALMDNKILAVGTFEEVSKYSSEKTELIDLKGKSVIPGIIDSHNHIWETGLLMDGIITFSIGSITELKEKIKNRISRMDKGQWLQGGSWIETQFTENRMPNKYDLDEVSPENPVVLERIFGTTVVNSLALKYAGIDKDTVVPEGGIIEKDPETGEPTGILHGTAILLVRKVMPGPFGSDDFGDASGEPDINVLEKSIKMAIENYIKLGITGVVEPGVSPTICRAYQNLYRRNELGLRVNLMPNWYGFTLKQQMDKMSRYIDDIGIYTGFGNEWVRFGGLKMAIDGGLTSKTALKSWPYLGEDAPREVKLRLDLDKLNGWVKQAHDSGWSVGIHVMGDTAIEAAVNAIYKAYKDNPVIRRHQIIHAYYPTEDSLKKMREAGIIACIQGSFIYGEADGYINLLTKEKMEEYTPTKTYLNSGVKIALGTDMPCADYNPFINMYAIITRKGIKGYQLGTKESINIKEALRMMTINGAYLTEEDNIKGSIEQGKLADLVVLDRALTDIDEEDIKNIKVEKTIIDGKIVYES
ncbi:amidohydrolase [Tissierella praeacuta]|uniref:amidohydrolase n=1 Tax=Tissierella praeacuta TaxID=43131 RepID=UPI00333F2605